jgi:hypothetical protein
MVRIPREDNIPKMQPLAVDLACPDATQDTVANSRVNSLYRHSGGNDWWPRGAAKAISALPAIISLVVTIVIFCRKGYLQGIDFSSLNVPSCGTLAVVHGKTGVDMPDRRSTRWYHLTPDRFLLGLLLVQGFLLLSERFQWFGFNERKGWTVLIAVGVVGVAVLVMLVWGLACLGLRRRFQFSFRALLLFVVALSVPLGWFAWESERARRQREAVEAMGKSVVYKDDLHASGDRPSLELALRLALRSFSDAETVLPRAPATTALLKVRTLAGVPDARPAWLRKSLGDDFFDDVIGVYRPDSKIKDADLEYLKRLTRLEDLSLRNTQVTDAGLEHLKGLTRLEWLELRGTNVTDEGVKRFQKALPNCEIYY